MGQLMILGSASAVPGRGQENTHFYLQAGGRSILIDSPGSPVVRLKDAGIDPVGITDIILTHFHPDHVAGFAPLLMDMWLMGRKEGLNVYGLEDTIDRARKMLDIYNWETWPNFYPVHFYLVPLEELNIVIDVDGLRILASPVQHLIPTIGLRFEFSGGKKIIAYSCDTEPSEAVVRLAQGAEVLIHEATGASVGHTSPAQAGEIARRAGVKELYLIHYPPEISNPECLVEEAQQTFSGRVFLAKDFLQISVE